MIIYKQQFLHSDWLKTCQLIPDQWNFISATLNHIRFVFFLSHYQRYRKKSLPRFVDNWKHQLGLESARAVLCKWATCARQTFLSKTFAKSLNIQKQYEKNVWEKSNDAYSLSIRVQITINHISIFTFLCFLCQYQRQRKCFLSERELRKALRDTLTRAAWFGPGVRFSKDPKTSRARRLFGALFGWISRVPESVSQRARKHPGFSPEFFGLFSRVCSASLTVIC